MVILKCYLINVQIDILNNLEMQKHQDDNYINRLSSSIIRQNTAKTENSNNSVISDEEKVDEFDDEHQSNMKTEYPLRHLR
jgi:hypothetical protein